TWAIPLPIVPAPTTPKISDTKNPLSCSLRPSAYLCVLCVKTHINAENAEIRRGPQRKAISRSPSRQRYHHRGTTKRSRAAHRVFSVRKESSSIISIQIARSHGPTRLRRH